MARRTRYQNQGEFSNDTSALQNKVSETMQLAVNNAKNAGNPTVATALQDRLEKEADLDAQYTASFMQAIDANGELVNDAAQNKALAASKEAIGKTHSAMGKAVSLPWPEGEKQAVTQAVDALEKQEKNINHKMHEIKTEEKSNAKPDKKGKNLGALEYGLGVTNGEDNEYFEESVPVGEKFGNAVAFAGGGY